MSTKVKYKLDGKKLRIILSNRQISSGAKLILLNLTSRIGGKNYSFPSQRNIAKGVGISERQVRKHIKVLKDLNVIRIRRRAINPKTGRHLYSNSYELSSVLRAIEIKTDENKQEV